MHLRVKLPELYCVHVSRNKSTRISIVELNICTLLIVLVTSRLTALTAPLIQVPAHDLVAIRFSTQTDKELAVTAKSESLDVGFVESDSVKHVTSLKIPNNNRCIEALILCLSCGHDCSVLAARNAGDLAFMTLHIGVLILSDRLYDKHVALRP